MSDLKTAAEAAKVLGLDELFRKSMKAYLMCKKINTDDLLRIWVEASEAGVDDIATKALSFALNNFVHIQKMESFKALPAEYLKVYVCHPHLQTRVVEERLRRCPTLGAR